MRISDWSSDVCSSDLQAVALALGAGGEPQHPADGQHGDDAEQDDQRALVEAFDAQRLQQPLLALRVEAEHEVVPAAAHPVADVQYRRPAAAEVPGPAVGEGVVDALGRDRGRRVHAPPAPTFPPYTGTGKRAGTRDGPRRGRGGGRRW